MGFVYRRHNWSTPLSIRQTISRELWELGGHEAPHSSLGWAVIFSFALNALVLTPLEVMMVRLSIQAKATQVVLLLDTPPVETSGPVR